MLTLAEHNHCLVTGECATNLWRRSEGDLALGRSPL